RHLDVVGAEHHRAVGIADLARGQPELDVRVGRLSCLGVSPLDPHYSAPCRLCDGSLRVLPQYKPATRYPRRDPGLRPRSDWLVALFNACSRGPCPKLSLVSPTDCCGTSERPGPQGTTSLSPAPQAARGAVTQTLAGERPAGLRTTRAEPAQAR